MIRRLVVAVACAAALSACSQPADEAAVTETPAAEETETAAAEAPVAQDIVDTAVANGSFSTLITAIDAAGLRDALKGAGPFTVFAPTDAAFAALPAGTVDTLLKPENKPALTGVLTYHVVAGRVTAPELIAMIKAGGGKATLNTVAGGALTASLEGDSVRITDAKGGAATVTIADVLQSNGVIHVVDKVLLPG